MEIAAGGSKRPESALHRPGVWEAALAGPLSIAPGIILETVCAWLLLTGPTVPVLVAAGLITHLAAVAAFAHGVRQVMTPSRTGHSNQNDNRAFAMLATVIALGAFPLYGMLGTLIAGAFVVRAFCPSPTLRERGAEAGVTANSLSQRERAVPTGEGHRSQGDGQLPLRLGEAWGERPSVEQLVARTRASETLLLDELEIEPLIDLLRDPDIELKRAAIDELARSMSADAVQLLRGLLLDTNPEVRLYASVGLSKLEDRISRAIVQAAMTAQAESATGLDHQRLGDLYMTYCSAGFLDAVSRDYYLGLAMQAYGRALEREPNSVAALLALGGAQGLRGDWPAARRTAEQARALAPDRTDVRLLALEAAFETGDLRAIANEAAEIVALPGASGEVRELAHWWSQAPMAGDGVTGAVNGFGERIERIADTATG